MLYLVSNRGVMDDEEEQLVPRVFSEDLNIKDLLRIAEAQVLELGVESCLFRSKVWYA